MQGKKNISYIPGKNKIFSLENIKLINNIIKQVTNNII
jgi:hypothetical protein